MFSTGAFASMTNYTTPVNEPSNGISITDTAGTISYHTNNQSIATPSQFNAYTDTNPSGIADGAAGVAMSSASDENAESQSMGSNTGVAGAPPESSSVSGSGDTYSYGFIVCGAGTAKEGTALDGYQISCMEDGSTASGASKVSISACNTDNGTDCGPTPQVITNADTQSAPNPEVSGQSGWGSFSSAISTGGTYSLSGGGTFTLGTCVPYAIHTCSGTQCSGVTYVNDLGKTVTCGTSNDNCDEFELPNPAYPVNHEVTCSAEVSQNKQFKSTDLYDISNKGENSESEGLHNSNSYVSDTVGTGVADNSGEVIFQGTTSNSANLATDILNNDGMQSCTENQVQQMGNNQGYVVTCNGQNDVPVAGESGSCSTGYTCNDFETHTQTVTKSCDESAHYSEAYVASTYPVISCFNKTSGINCGDDKCQNIDNIVNEYRENYTWQCPVCHQEQKTRQVCTSSSTAPSGQVCTTEHYTVTVCTDPPTAPEHSVTAYFTCVGYGLYNEQTGFAGSQPSGPYPTPAEAISGDYGQSETDYCKGYTQTAYPTCSTGGPYNVQTNDYTVINYKEYADCPGEAQSQVGCSVTNPHVNEDPSSCPAPMSMTDNTSPIQDCSFGALAQDANGNFINNNYGGTYYGSCANPKATGKYEMAVSDNPNCSVIERSVCTITRDGSCIQPWEFYDCQGAMRACPGT